MYPINSIFFLNFMLILFRVLTSISILFIVIFGLYYILYKCVLIKIKFFRELLKELQVNTNIDAK